MEEIKRRGRPTTKRPAGKTSLRVNSRRIQVSVSSDLLSRIQAKTLVSGTAFFRVFGKNAEQLFWKQLKKAVRKFLNGNDWLAKAIIKKTILDDVKTIDSLLQYDDFKGVNALVLAWCLMYRERSLDCSIKQYIDKMRG